MAKLTELTAHSRSLSLLSGILSTDALGGLLLGIEYDTE